MDNEHERLYFKGRGPLLTTTPAWAINFTNEDGEPVGRLSFDDDGELTFKGDADASGKLFFGVVINTNSEKLKELNDKLALAKTVAKQLLRAVECPNAHCVDGVISKGFEPPYEHFQCQWCDEKQELLDG